MADEEKKLKTTLIKHSKGTQGTQQPVSEPNEPEVTRPVEKKKVVVVKKKVVVVRPQVRSEESVPEVKPQITEPAVETPKSAVKKDSVVAAAAVEPSPPQKQEERAAASAQPQIESAVVIEKPVSERETKQTGETKRPSVRGPSAPVVRSPKNLPPVPGQGQTAAVHAEWRSKNMNNSTSAPRSQGRNGGEQNRAPYQQGERPPYQPGTRPPYQQGSRPPYQQGSRPPYQQGSRPPYQQGSRPPYQPGSRPPYQQGSRPPYQQGSRPPYQGTGGRPGGARPPYNGPRTGGYGGKPRTPSVTPDSMEPVAQKTTKKVFKKKREDFKKPDRITEKDFQIKRKEIQKANPVPKKIDMMEVITVSDLARKMNLKASEIIGKLFKMGMMVTINQQIDSDTATLIASDYDCEVNIVSLYDETLIASEADTPDTLKSRAPIVTVMGHVDHGKTKLLDAIRSTKVAEGEFGGITQHIGAYKVQLTGKGDIVFLDTPGHAAFTMMRARGAQVTDIVVLVVAANDGVMPQTVEAIDHAKAAKVPIIVAINKIDLPEANPDHVKQQLSDLGLLPEAWGGSTLYCEISALKRVGIDELLDTILLQAEMLELTATADTRAEGKVLESRIDQGRGIVATVLVERGTLHQGDNFVAGIYPGKVRAMVDDRGNKITEAGPATPVEIIGLSDIPGAGDPFQVTESEKQARQVGSKRQELERMGAAKNVKKVTLDNIFETMKDGNVQDFNVIIKGDVQGSVEAVQNALEKLSNDEIRLNVLRASAGAIIEDDINLAIASEALVLGFNVRPTPKAQVLADYEKIEIRKYNIIYDAIDDIRDAMEGMLAPEKKENVIGRVEVRETFHVPKIGTIAGSYVLEGKVKRNAQVNVIRDSIHIKSDKISSLKRFKDDAREVAAGFECGVGLENFQDLKIGDILEIVEVVEVAKKLKSNE
ncbi:MAG: translation initiation factor IF-2 [Sphaerochaetaceae bacterium]|nr:translation initiation factor IF-2 [Sphaerochaetaceae bacterium]NLO60485.1 translation initiation factor IF-2 [Spirochaetales bacterium]